MTYTDTHTHLDSSRFDADRDAVITRARAAGVSQLITCGASLPSSHLAVALAAQHEAIWAAVGVHGHEASSIALAPRAGNPAWGVAETALAELAALARMPRVVAIGEIGLDYHYDFSPREAQRAVLVRQLALAAALDLPVILHNREADADTRHLLDEAPAGLRGVLHCFLADQALADWAVARGLYLGVAGPITFKKMEPLAQIVRSVPHERLLIETDSPYLAPHPLRGTRNEPANVVLVAERLAAVLGLTPPELAELTTANAKRLFRLD